jgi:hypothetical protein
MAQEVFVFDARRNAVTGKFGNMDIVRGQPLTGGKWLKNVVVFQNTDGDLKEYPSSSNTSETATVRTARYALDEAGEERIGKIKVVYEGTATVMVYSYNHRYETTPYRVITCTGISSDTWFVLPLNVKSSFIEIQVSGFTTLKAIFIQ